MRSENMRENERRLPKESIPIPNKIVLLTGANLALMAGSSLSPAMPAILAEFETLAGAEFLASMILTLPALFLVIGGPIAGFLTDRLGRKPVLVISIFLSGLFGSSGYFLSSIGILLMTRALMGLSLAGATTATNALIGDYFTGQQRAKYMGLNAAITAFMGVIFMPLGGLLADINWHYAFLTHLPLLVLFPLGIIFIQEPDSTSTARLSDKKTRLRINSMIIYIFVAVFISQFTFATVPVCGAYFVTELLNVGALEVGLISAASSLFGFIGGLLYERISRRMGFRHIAIWDYLFFGVGFLVLGFAGSLPMVIIGQLILGFCSGLNLSNLTTWLSSHFGKETRGRANGIYVMLMALGNFLMSVVFTPIVNLTSYRHTYFISAIIILLLGVVGIFLRHEGSHALDADENL